MRMRREWLGDCGRVVLFLMGALSVRAGNLDSPGAPTAPASAMYTLEAIYNRLDTGAAGAQQVFTDPVSGPTSGTMHTLNEVMAQAPLLDAVNGATAAQVLTGKSFWGLLSGTGWGTLTGTMPNNGAVSITPTTSAQIVAAGYHNGAGSVAGDEDLVTGNIRAGVSIFGVAGKTEVVDTTTGTGATAFEVVVGKTVYVNGAAVTGTRPLSTLGKTGQTPVYRAGDDGTYQKGVAPTGARFTKHGNGTVTDNLTGFMWAQNANLWGEIIWNTAVDNCEGLVLGGFTDWRLPNVHELQSLIDYGRVYPTLPLGHPFTGVVSSLYWTSTTSSGYTTYAWLVNLYYGYVYDDDKVNAYYVWPVRGGQ